MPLADSPLDVHNPRKVEDLPHIRRRSREDNVPKLCSYQWRAHSGNEKAKFYECKTRLFSIFFLLSLAATSYGQASQKATAKPINAVQWSPVELSFTASQPLAWRTFPLQVIFTQGQHKLELDAYWDGGKGWKVRFAPPRAGEWRYTTVSTEASLNKLTGVIVAAAPSAQQLQANANHRLQNQRRSPRCRTCWPNQASRMCCT